MMNHDSYLEVLTAIRSRPESVLLALDFDGTLSSIVPNPTEAFADPAAIDALARLGPRLGTIAIITGRSVQAVLDLARLQGRRGFENLVILGHYGAERFDLESGLVELHAPPAGLDQLVLAVEELLARSALPGVTLERKLRSAVVHTRNSEDPAEAFSRLGPEVEAIAERFDLSAEPGRFVWEIRDSSIDKGKALAALMSEKACETVIYAGDDLGDLPAFEVVEEFRRGSRHGVLVCSASAEQDALEARADVVVDGPLGIAIWLTELATDIGA